MLPNGGNQRAKGGDRSGRLQSRGGPTVKGETGPGHFFRDRYITPRTFHFDFWRCVDVLYIIYIYIIYRVMLLRSWRCCCVLVSVFGHKVRFRVHVCQGSGHDGPNVIQKNRSFMTYCDVYGCLFPFARIDRQIRSNFLQNLEQRKRRGRKYW